MRQAEAFVGTADALADREPAVAPSEPAAVLLNNLSEALVLLYGPSHLNATYRAQRLTSSDQAPEVVAVKQAKLSMVGIGKALEREGAVLKALSGKPYTVPFHSIHLPPTDKADKPAEGSAYLVMGQASGLSCYTALYATTALCFAAESMLNPFPHPLHTICCT